MTATASTKRLRRTPIFFLAWLALAVAIPLGAVTSFSAPVILTQPANQAVAPGKTATFSVVASGAQPLQYQWLFNGVPLAGAYSSTLTLNFVQPARAGNYSVLVSDSSGTVTSAPAVLMVGNFSMPMIGTQPSSQTVAAGANVNFNVSASGTAPLGYQWLFNGATISGATGATLSLTAVQSAQAGNYVAVVSNAMGAVTSAVAVLTVTNPGPPVIATQPASQTVTAGTNVNFSVTATGAPPLNYQWRFNGANITSATSSMYSLANVQSAQAGGYSAVIGNSVGSVTSAVAVLTVTNPIPPTIVTQPASQTVAAGVNVSFNVAASGTPPFSYQWRFNGANVSGATGATYSLTSVQPAQAGNYSVVVGNSAGAATSSVAVLSVTITTTPPSIVTQPSSQTVIAGTSASFSVAATGTVPLQYQWLFNGANVSGATGTTYSLANVQSTQAGNYSVVVTNSAGAVTSAVAVLTVTSSGAPAIVTPPANQVVAPGKSVTFSVVATGTQPLQYQWLFNGAPLAGAYSPTLTLNFVQANRAGNYSAVVINSSGSVTSAPAVLTVGNVTPPTISSQPASQATTTGANVSFTVGANGTAPLSYQWLFNGASLSGATGATLSLTKVQTTQSGNYSVIVTNSFGAATSAVAVLTVTNPIPPSIVTQPASQTVTGGTNVNFTVVATGTPPLAYQWRFNGANVSGATATVYSLANVQTAQSGNYTLVVSNFVSAVTSAVAVLTVTNPIPPTIVTQPTSQTVAAGVNVSFNVAATGTPPFSYQWLFNGASLSGATSTTLSLTGVQLGNAGNYTAVVKNVAGSATSAVALLTVQLPPGTVAVNGGVTYQTIDGFGVNANHRSWNNGELQPVVDALIDQAGFTIFHVIFDNNNWEGTNDNSDPNNMNWAYYNTVYSSPDFQQMWAMMKYLNQRGITTGLVPDFEGPPPLWMGGETNLTPGFENEYAEELASAVVYARKNQGLQFTTVGPINEPDITGTGVHLPGGASQLVTIFHDFGQQLDNNGLSDVRFSGPDRANTDTSWLGAMMGDPYVMSKLSEFGTHAYLNETVDVSGVYNFIKQSAYPNTHFWLTEYNVWCPSCQTGGAGNNTWTNARGISSYLLTLLSQGASAGVVWEGYDSQYLYYDATTGGNDGPHWSYWGLFAVNDINATPKTYTPRKGFYTLSQISLFVRPGAQRIDVSSAGSPLSLLAFYNPNSGQVTLTGVNSRSVATNLTCVLAGLPAVPAMNLYYTSSNVNLANGGQVPVSGGSFSITVPADCVFTLVSTNTGGLLSVGGSGSSTAVTSAILHESAAQNDSVQPSSSVATNSIVKFPDAPTSTLTIDGSVVYQPIDGFGVNANSLSWTNDELKPVIDAYINQAGMTLFHAIVENSNWETTNDDSSAFNMNWSYYTNIYNSTDFQKLWGMMAYLNQRGITNGLIPKPGGPVALWMGGQTLASGFENEYAETMVSMLAYARSNQNLKFSEARVSNEPDITLSGEHMTQAQYITSSHASGLLLDTNGMSDVRFSGPDLANTTTSWMTAMMNDPYLMSKVSHFGVHGYLNETVDASGIYNFIKHSSYSNLNFWMTEFNVWCPSCNNGTSPNTNWSYARDIGGYLLTLLGQGASAAIAFEAWDSQYYGYNTSTGQSLPLTWSYWGLVGVDSINASPRTYTPRKGYYTFAQVSAFVRPGAQRISVSTTPSGMALQAFYNTNNAQFTLVGVNSNSTPTNLSCTLASLPAIPGLNLYYTSATTNLALGAHVVVTNGAFSFTAPADSVFTLTYSNVPPYFTVPATQSNGLALLLNGQLGFTYQILTSTDLVSWVALTNIVNTNGTAVFTDTNAPNLPSQFYRALLIN